MTLYFDHNATAPLHPAARAAMCAAMDVVGNPSSVHSAGQQARGIVERARAQVAKALNVDEKGIVFTASGTEANNMVLTPHWRGCGYDLPLSCMLCAATEHVSVINGSHFAPELCFSIPVDAHGRVLPNVLRGELVKLAAQFDVPPLVSIQLANNETGVIQNIPELAAIVHEFGALLHVDASQGLGRIPIDMQTLGADIVTASAHKCGGPLGVGIIARRSHKMELAQSLIRGGGQEGGQRAGTQNVPAIAGLGALLPSPLAGEGGQRPDEGYKTTQQDNPSPFAALLPLPQGAREHIEHSLLTTFPTAIIFGQNAPRLPNTTLFAIPGITAEKALMAFDIAGVALSSGSACSSGKVGKSHVLKAMGVADELAACAIRISTGWNTTQDEITKFLTVAHTVLTRLAARAEKRVA